MPDIHAKLSPSSASRFLECTNSPTLESQFPDTESTYAAEGTLAHSLAELKLRKQFSPMSDTEYKNQLAEIKANPLYNAEMNTHTDTYVEYILSICHAFSSPPYVVPEKRVDISHVVPESFGTSDCVILWENTLHVIDLKYGKGIEVSAENNPQLRLYALGAVKEYAMLYDIHEITLHIVQPRIDNISSETLSITELNAWADSIRPLAQQAYTGTGSFHAGEWCRFCRAKAQCRTRAESLLALEEPKIRQESGQILSDDEIGELLTKSRELKSWVENLEKYVTNQLLAGKSISGWKLVEGRANRTIPDYSKAVAKLTSAGYEESMLFERKPLGVTALDKLVGGQAKLKEILGDTLDKPAGKPTLAPESDKRKPYSQSKLEAMFSSETNTQEVLS